MTHGATPAGWGQVWQVNKLLGVLRGRHRAGGLFELHLLPAVVGRATPASLLSILHQSWLSVLFFADDISMCTRTCMQQQQQQQEPMGATRLHM